MGPCYALETKGDGNCLLHAVSIAICGVHDNAPNSNPHHLPHNLPPLRKALQEFMNSEWAIERLRLHFRASLRRMGYTDVEGMDKEFEKELVAVENPTYYLSAIHCFAVANLLRRPLIVYRYFK